MKESGSNDDFDALEDLHTVSIPSHDPEAPRIDFPIAGSAYLFLIARGNADGSSTTSNKGKLPQKVKCLPRSCTHQAIELYKRFALLESDEERAAHVSAWIKIPENKRHFLPALELAHELEHRLLFSSLVEHFAPLIRSLQPPITWPPQNYEDIIRRIRGLFGLPDSRPLNENDLQVLDKYYGGPGRVDLTRSTIPSHQRLSLLSSHSAATTPPQPPSTDPDSVVEFFDDLKPVEWEPDEIATVCPGCKYKFAVLFLYGTRSTHCRRCGHRYCTSCAKYEIASNYVKVLKPNGDDKKENPVACPSCHEDVEVLKTREYLEKALVQAGFSLLELHILRLVFKHPVNAVLECFWVFARRSIVTKQLHGHVSNIVKAGPEIFIGHPPMVALYLRSVNWGIPTEANRALDILKKTLSDLSIEPQKTVRCVPHWNLLCSSSCAVSRDYFDFIAVELLGYLGQEKTGVEVVIALLTDYLVSRIKRSRSVYPPAAPETVACILPIVLHFLPVESYTLRCAALRILQAMAACDTWFAVAALFAVCSSSISYPSKDEWQLRDFILSVLDSEVREQILNTLAFGKILEDISSKTTSGATVPQIQMMLKAQLETDARLSTMKCRTEEKFSTTTSFPSVPALCDLGNSTRCSRVVSVVDQPAAADVDPPVAVEGNGEVGPKSKSSRTAASASIKINKPVEDVQIQPMLWPFNPDIVIKSVCLSGISIKVSKEAPVVIPLRDTEGNIHKLLFKRANLWGDHVLCNMMRFLHFLVRPQLGISVPMYRCLPTSNVCGMIEFVPNTRSVQNLHDDQPSEVAPVLGFLRARQPTADVANNCIASARFFILSNFLFGIGDRHRNNVLVTDDGRMLHIDFGMIFQKTVAESVTSKEYVRFDQDLIRCVEAFHPRRTEKLDSFRTEVGELFCAVRPFVFAFVPQLKLLHRLKILEKFKSVDELNEAILDIFQVGVAKEQAMLAFKRRVQNAEGSTWLKDYTYDKTRSISATLTWVNEQVRVWFAGNAAPTD